ncbi:MAG: FAD-dependent oxidoreductase [Pyrinomonadaceae bacterium]
MSRITTDILIVGGGAAGLSAAAEASAMTKVTLVDDNPKLGGQVWRAEMGLLKSPEAKHLIEQVEAGNVRIINDAQVFGCDGPNRLLAETPAGRLEIQFEKMILATGARERFLPFPGWTLPNIFGAGGLQALVKGGLKIRGKRVVVSGTGPLLLAVADYLNSKGANVLLIAEQTPAAKVRRFARGLWRQPSKMVEAAALRARLVSIPYKTDSWVTSAAGSQHFLRSVNIFRNGKVQTIECDYLACGFHLVPNIELASVLGAVIKDGFVAIDEFQQTSLDNVYCAGEPTGIAGLESSLIEGKIAGLAAVGQLGAARSHFAARNKARRFGEALNKAFALRTELKTLANAETIVCRCEDVTHLRLSEFANSRDAKLQARCGMGSCQGRVCGPATEFIFGWKPGSVRPPIFPVKLENL